MIRRLFDVLFVVACVVACVFGACGCNRQPEDETPRVVRTLADVACELVTTHPDVPTVVAAIAAVVCDELAAEFAAEDDAGTDAGSEDAP